MNLLGPVVNVKMSLAKKKTWIDLTGDKLRFIFFRSCLGYAVMAMGYEWIIIKLHCIEMFLMELDTKELFVRWLG